MSRCDGQLVELVRLSYSIILQASWVLHCMRVGFLKHSWLDPRDASWCLHIELVLLFSVGANRSEKIEVFCVTTAYCTGWFLSMNILLSFPFTSSVPCLFG